MVLGNFICINMIEDKALAATEDVVKNLGFEIVKIKFDGLKGKKVLDILIETKNGESVTISDCKKVSKNISLILDMQDFIRDKFILSVSSCGVERPLVKLNDFVKFIGRVAFFNLSEKIGDSKKITGTIKDVIESDIKIVSISNNEEIAIPFKGIKSANLVYTDEMFRENLKNGKIN